MESAGRLHNFGATFFTTGGPKFDEAWVYHEAKPKSVKKKAPKKVKKSPGVTQTAKGHGVATYFLSCECAKQIHVPRQYSLLLPKSAYGHCPFSQQRIHGPDVIHRGKPAYVTAHSASCSRERIHGPGVIQTNLGWTVLPSTTNTDCSCSQQKIHGLNTEDPTSRYPWNTGFNSPKIVPSRIVMKYAILPPCISRNYCERCINKDQSPGNSPCRPYFTSHC